MAGARHNTRELVHGLSKLATLRGVIGLKRHVENPYRDHHPEQRLQVAAHLVVIHNGDENSKYDDMDKSLHILAVINGTHTRNDAEQKGQSRRNSRVSYGPGRLRGSKRRWFGRRVRRCRGWRRGRGPGRITNCRRMLVAIDR